MRHARSPQWGANPVTDAQKARTFLAIYALGLSRHAAASALLYPLRMPAEPAKSWLADTAGAVRRGRLRYVSCAGRGIRRVRAGKRFRYVTPAGAVVTDATELGRIRALAIPPAWSNVWICPNAGGHLQATGRDARGRKQYRYHARWRVVRDEAKYHDMLAFARALPRLRRQVMRDLASPRLTKDKVLAAVIRIMERTAIRVGNDSYAQENGSYGLTTLQDRHARIHGAAVELTFRGKSKQHQRAKLTDAQLARIVKRCRDLPGQRLFQYQDDAGKVTAVTSSDVNGYLKRVTGGPFTSKTFRTWAATVFATSLFTREERPGTERERRSVVSRIIERVAAELGNTPAVCRKSYVHPAVVIAYAEGRLRRAAHGAKAKLPGGSRLRREEIAVLALLETRKPRRAA